MRRLARHLYTGCAAVSLLTSVALAAMWVRSYRVTDRWAFLGRPEADGPGLRHAAPLWVTSINGGLGFRLGGGVAVGAENRAGPRLGRVWYSRYTSAPTAYPAAAYASGERRPWHGFIVARGEAGSWRNPVTFWHVTVPYWAASAASAGLPLIWARRWMRRRRAAGRATAGRCAGCGYDLRASPARCPECGLLAGAPT